MPPTRTEKTLEVCPDEYTVSKRVDRKRGLSAIWCFLLALPGLVLIFGHRVASLGYVTDFAGFLAGAKLLGTQHLYDVAVNLAQQKALTGATDPSIIFVRLPFWAFVMKPFLLPTYVHALFLWRTMLVAALIPCGLLGGRLRRYYFLALSWSVPAAGCVLMGNDSPLVLLFILISMLCWRKKHRLLAGVVLGLCLAKFHFLVFLPLLLLRKEYRRELTGFSLSVAVLTAVNFAVQPDWILLYWHALNLPQPNMNVHASLMPNFYATFFWTGHPGYAVAIGAAMVLALAWPICRCLSFDIGMPLCIFCGLLAAPHTNPLDGVLAIPALVEVYHRFPQIRPLALFLLSPVAGLLSFFGPQTVGPAIVVAASLALLATALYWTAPGRTGGLVEKLHPAP